MKATRTTVCGLVLAFATGAGVLLAQGQAPKQQAHHADVVRHGFESRSQPGAQHAIEQQVTTVERDGDPVSSLAIARTGQRSRSRSGNPV